MAAKKSADLTVVEGPITSQSVATTQDSNVFSAIERIMTDPSASVERANQAFEFYQKVEADKNRKAFNQAIADAKAEMPEILKTRKGHNNKKYADFADFARAADPVLSKHGLQYRFRTTQDERIHVTCIVSHRLGHFEENTLSGPPDSTGNKNAIQAIGSTLTYMQRYTLTQALGLAASEDDDGQVAGGNEAVSDEQLKVLRRLLKETNTPEEKFLADITKTETLDDVRAAAFTALVGMLETKKRIMQKAKTEAPV
jgi:uncharacterized membrane protein